MADVQYSLVPVDHDPFGHSDEDLQKYSDELAERQAAADVDRGAMTHRAGHTLLDDPAVPFDAKVGALALDTPRRMAAGVLGLPGDAYALGNSLRVGEPVTPEQAGQSLQIAGGVMGAGTPFAEAGALGSSGGKLLHKSEIPNTPWSPAAKEYMLDQAQQHMDAYTYGDGSESDYHIGSFLHKSGHNGGPNDTMPSAGSPGASIIAGHMDQADKLHEATPAASSWSAAGVPKETYGWHPDAFQHLEDTGLAHVAAMDKLPPGAEADAHYSQAEQFANMQKAGPDKDFPVSTSNLHYLDLLDEWSKAKGLHWEGTEGSGAAGPSGTVNMSEEKGPWNPSALSHLQDFKNHNQYTAKAAMDQLSGVETNGLSHPLDATKPGYWSASDLLEEMKDKHSADIVKSGAYKPTPEQFPAGASSVYSAPLSTRQVDLTKAIRPIENWSNYRPPEGNPMSFPASSITQGRAQAQGYNTGLPMFKGMENRMDADAFWDPSTKPNERAIFASDRPEVAQNYSGGGFGHNLAPMVARADKPFEVHWPDVAGDEGYNGHTMRAIIEHTRAQGGDALVIRNIRDLGGKQTQYAFMDPSKLRVRHAEFDPNQLASSNLLSSRGPAGLALPQDDPRRKDVVLRSVDHDPFAEGEAQ